MYWNWDTMVEAVFFKEWMIMNTTELVLSVFGVFLLAAMYEGMNVIRTKTDAWIDARARERIRKKNNAYNPESANNTCNCPCASDSNSKGIYIMFRWRPK